MSWLHPFAGTYTYRSFHNIPDPVNGDKDKALALIFGEGDLTAESDPDVTVFRAVLSFGPDYLMDLSGRVELSFFDQPTTLAVRGLGRTGTKTDGWIYDYFGILTPRWPSGIKQVPALVGTVIRTVPHGTAQAGYVASFVAVKRA